MADLSDVKRSQIVGARMTGASATKTAELFGEASSTVPEVITGFEKEGKTSSLKQNSGRKRELSDRDRQTLTWIIRMDHKNTVPKIIASREPTFLKNCKKGATQSRISREGCNQKRILK